MQQAGEREQRLSIPTIYKSVLCSLMCSTDSYLRKYDNVLSCTYLCVEHDGSEGLPTVNTVTVTGAYTLGQPCGSVPAPATHTLSPCLTDRARDPGPAVTYRAIFRVRRVLAWHTHSPQAELEKVDALSPFGVYQGLTYHDSMPSSFFLLFLLFCRPSPFYVIV